MKDAISNTPCSYSSVASVLPGTDARPVTVSTNSVQIPTRDNPTHGAVGAQAGKGSTSTVQQAQPEVRIPNNSSRGRGRGGSSFRGRSSGRGRGNQTFTTEMLSRAISVSSLDRGSTYSDKTRDQSNDSGDFQVPSYLAKKQRRQDARRRKVITGTKGNVGSFKGAPEPSRDFFVSRVATDVSTTDIRDYLTERDISVRLLDKVSHEDAKFQSFKLTVPVSSVKDLLSDDVWPCGVKVRRYIVQKPRNIETW